MKDRRKLALILLILVAISCLVCAIWHLMVKPEIYQPNLIRPKDFPEILIVPESVQKVDYRSSSTVGAYSVTFIVHDPYPSEETQTFIKKHLKSHGWQRLNYHLLNPDVPASCTPLLRIKWPRPEGRKGDQPVRWMEDWLNANNESISVDCTYALLNENELDLNRLDVHLTFFERNSWIHRYVLRYKELHPGEFAESTAAGQFGEQ